MYLETERLIIRNFEETDTDALYRLKYDKQVLKYDPTFIKRDADISDIHEAILYFISVKDSDSFDKDVYFAIVLKNTNSVIGAITVSKLEYLYELQIGWMICEEHSGHGYASEAGTAASDYLLRTFPYDYLVVVMDVDNPASFRTAQKCGFKLFEKRIGYNYFFSKCNVENFDEVSKYFEMNEKQVGSCYYYFRKFNPKTISRFYGDTVYDGRFS